MNNNIDTPKILTPVKDQLGRSYSTGKRKNAIARVWVKAGKGNFSINGRELHNYFPRPNLVMKINQPFVATNNHNKFDVFCTIKGGGNSGQAEALRHGIALALRQFDPTLAEILRQHGLVTRDSRIVERKKYGRHKARKRFQFSKR